MNFPLVPHDWSKEALLNKAQRYAEAMLRCQRDDWQFGFWSSLLLEHLTRATLAHISPALLADGKDWNNIYYALGHKPAAAKFQPKSAGIVDLLARVESILPRFTRELFGFCVEHVNKRNEELHTGACPYDALGTAAWQPRFYAACAVLLESVGLDLEAIFGPDEARSARILIDSLNDQAAAVVQSTIKAHSVVWHSKPEVERTVLLAQASAWASRTQGHRVQCPSCGSQALVSGSPQAPPTTHIESDMIVERRPMLPASFECVACGLKILGFSKLNACGLGDMFTATAGYDAAEYFGDSDDYGPEPDYNDGDL